MEKMYQEFKDIAEFRMVYINEAHAMDSDWAVGYAADLGIKDHTNYEERCQTADMLISDKELTIPTIIDGMDNAVNKAYSAWPDRVFLIRSDGRLGLAGGQGPWGYKPAMDEARTWLTELRKTGDEPALPEGALEAAQERAKVAKVKAEGKGDGQDAKSDKKDSTTDHKGLVGNWDMATDFNGQTIEAVLTLTSADGVLGGTWVSMGQEMTLSDVAFDGKTLSFSRTMGQGGAELTYSGEVAGDSIEGHYTAPSGELECNGKRQSAEDEGEEKQAGAAGVDRPMANYTSKYPMGRKHSRPIIEKDGRTLLWAKGSTEEGAADTEWFDMTDALIDPVDFQYGIGKDTIAPILDPKYAKPGDARLADFGIDDDTVVVGFEHNGIARAYPISILNGHEVVNDDFGGTLFAVCW